MISDLASKDCVPCKGGVPPLKGDQIRGLLAELGHEWKVIDDHHLQKDFVVGNFADALAFANRVGEIAEAQGHHPDLHVAWGRLGVTIWTHKIDGLTESDFVLAAKCEEAG